MVLLNNIMTKNDSGIVVRFPPSPTGEIHIGNMRTLLFNYLFARKHGGKIVFRFEDTDKERSRKEFEQGMIDGLRTLGLDFDEGPYRQTERVEIYRKYLHLLVEKGLAYEAEQNTAGTGKVIRIKNNEKDIIWNDLVKGEIIINTHTFKDESGNPDLVIARSIDDAIYHFTVVVDDWLMGVTHVIRGDDHTTSTPRQIMIIEALQKLEELLHEDDIVMPVVPTYAHLPTIVGEDKKKLSKRNGVTALKSFLDLGYLPETMVNYLALLGWNPGDEREFFTLEELVKEFSFERCQKSPAQFDFKKLDNINKHYLGMPYLRYVTARVVLSFFIASICRCTSADPFWDNEQI
jgi:glutamyl-tRNA synthetase